MEILIRVGGGAKPKIASDPKNALASLKLKGWKRLGKSVRKTNLNNLHLYY